MSESEGLDGWKTFSSPIGVLIFILLIRVRFSLVLYFPLTNTGPDRTRESGFSRRPTRAHILNKSRSSWEHDLGRRFFRKCNDQQLRRPRPPWSSSSSLLVLVVVVVYSSSLSYLFFVFYSREQLMNNISIICLHLLRVLASERSF